MSTPDGAGDRHSFVESLLPGFDTPLHHANQVVSAQA